MKNDCVEIKENIQFLKDLQVEMNTQETDGQAAPRFWVIMDYCWEPTSEDHSEKIELYDCEECTTVELNDYVSEIVDFEGDRHLEFDRDQREELNNIYLYECPTEVMEWIDDNDDASRYYMIHSQETSFIAYNTCFFTKQEAIDHLKSNRHHYSDKAHTFAMTAWRAPKMERLFKILESFDWDAIKHV